MKRRGSRLEDLGVWIAAASLAVFASMAAQPTFAGIAATKHNLGATGTQAIHVSAGGGTEEICVFCHTPHGANTSVTAPLWNKGLPATTYQLYGTGGNSATLDGEVLAVGSVSAACLSCHDGTQAMDNMINAPGSGGYNSGGLSAGYTWTGTLDGKMPAGGITNLGADLRNDHPVGIAYCGGGLTEAGGTCVDGDFNAATSGTINGTIQWWVNTSGGTANREKADMILYRRTFAAGTGPSVECASCHDPHVEDTATRKTFLRVANTGSALCLTCHNK